MLPVDVAAAVYVAKAGRTGSLDTVRWRATQSCVSTHNHAQTYLPESFKPPSELTAVLAERHARLFAPRRCEVFTHCANASITINVSLLAPH